MPKPIWKGFFILLLICNCGRVKWKGTTAFCECVFVVFVCERLCFKYEPCLLPQIGREIDSIIYYKTVSSLC